MALFKWSYRRLREKIELGEQTGEFSKFVQSCFNEVGRDYCEEFGGIQTDEPCKPSVSAANPMVNVQSSVPTISECPGTSEQPHVIPVLDAELGSNAESNEEPSLTSITTVEASGDSAAVTTPSKEPRVDSAPEADCYIEYRRGKTVLFTAEQNGQVNKGMVIDLTPRKSMSKLQPIPERGQQQLLLSS